MGADAIFKSCRLLLPLRTFRSPSRLNVTVMLLVAVHLSSKPTHSLSTVQIAAAAALIGALMLYVRSDILG